MKLKQKRYAGHHSSREPAAGVICSLFLRWMDKLDGMNSESYLTPVRRVALAAGAVVLVGVTLAWSSMEKQFSIALHRSSNWACEATCPIAKSHVDWFSTTGFDVVSRLLR